MIPFSPFSEAVGGFIGRDRTSLVGLGLQRESLFQLTQVHGDHILRLSGAEEIASVRALPGDALITDRPLLPVAVRAADCVPILIAHPGGAVAAVHAGWKGSRAEIVKKTLAMMKTEMGLDPFAAVLSIGPAICERCYEVGGEVAGFFSRFSGCVQALSEDKFLLDLKTINLRLAEEAGADPAKIRMHPECTLCQEKDFYSYRGETKRGEKGEGRNIAWVMLR